MVRRCVGLALFVLSAKGGPEGTQPELPGSPGDCQIARPDCH
jgi:hypothetical protein